MKTIKRFDLDYIIWPQTKGIFLKRKTWYNGNDKLLVNDIEEAIIKFNKGNTQIDDYPDLREILFGIKKSEIREDEAWGRIATFWYNAIEKSCKHLIMLLII
jgi:hypothetical protein